MTDITLQNKLTADLSELIRRLELTLDDVAHKKDVAFWKQCVRDTTGTLLNYSHVRSNYGNTYFKGGQSRVNYKKPEEVEYLLRNIRTRIRFYNDLPSIVTFKENAFKEWLNALRSSMSYRPVDYWLHDHSLVHAGHTKIVRELVLPITQAYDDPYYTGSTRGPLFEGFPAAALPKDVRKGKLIYHHYPSLIWSDRYLSEALMDLQQLLAKERLPSYEYISQIAHFYQLLINLHLFAAINGSLYMNMANALIELTGLKGIEHGIHDFVALRMQPHNFQRYFYDAVMAHQSP